MRTILLVVGDDDEKRFWHDGGGEGWGDEVNVIEWMDGWEEADSVVAGGDGADFALRFGRRAMPASSDALEKGRREQLPNRAFV